MSAAALITSWVGAAFPLLPGVALLLALAGRKRSATRWLNTVAIVVSALFLAAQIVIAAVFGSVLVKGISDLTNRDDTTLAGSQDYLSDDGYDDGSADAAGDTQGAPGVDGGADVEQDGAAVATSPGSLAPGTDAILDGGYQDLLASALEDSGFSPSDFTDSNLYQAATITCTGLEAGSDFTTVTGDVNSTLPIPRAVAGSVTASAVNIYCPQYIEAIVPQ
nr:DUF732 domain-containing protein [Kineococcus vitellinus]